MDILIVILVGIAALAIYGYSAGKAFQADPSGGVTPEQRTALGSELSADEEMLACVLSTPPFGAQQQDADKRTEWLAGAAGLTPRRLRLIVIGPGSKMIIPLRHVIAFGAVGQGTEENIDLTAADGRKYRLWWRHTSSWRRFREQLSAVLALQSSPAGLSGAGTELEKLAELVNRGVLTSSDFERAKGLFLGKPVSQVQESVQLLENLYVLHKQGVLSESEFNMKKWDILSRTGVKR